MVAAHHPNWQKVGDDGLTLRQSTISFLALTLNAIAIVGNQQGDQNEWLTKLGLIDWSATNPEWDGLIRFSQRIVKNSHTTKALAEYIATQTGAL
ncbi:DNA sulfur modification protein DndB [Leptolyngbya sp. AN03gr2]|uniref:DNA sulfur modification protein DndB n=1 Tax=unclassified Leptolyngbya TaxID=2650499 RepID=UPI003D321F16